MENSQALIASPLRFGEVAIAWIGLYGMAVVMGYGRFLFTATLPDIIVQLELSTAMAGWLASINYIGYFLGAIIAMFVPQRHTWLALIIASVVSIVTTAALAIPDMSIFIWQVIRLIAGIASGVAMILGSSYVVKHFSLSRRAMLSTIHYGGIGVGITASAALTWSLLSMGYHFATIWWVAALTSLPLLLLLIKIRPSAAEKQLSPNASYLSTTIPATDNSTITASTALSDQDQSTVYYSQHLPAHSNAIANSHSIVNKLSQLKGFMKTALANQGYVVTLLLISYGLSGFGYITSATFLPVMATQSLGADVGGAQGLSGQEAGLLIWLLVGILATFSNPLWGRLARDIGEFKTLIGLIILQAFGMFLPILIPGAIGLYGNAIILGATFVGIVSMTLGIIKEINPNYSNLLIGLATLAYAIGQFLGPLVTVALAGKHDNFNAGLAVAGGGLIIGLVLILLIRLLPKSKLESESTLHSG
ncbi:YbfB/YjiJ family MFS transporter [Psychrobacter arenosus]|uniref:YbfB/YjiJ family MFS transporter n=1 Tax=Psychrobacter arenosus TaxID=256326 RepID=UPI001919FEA4|nr:YbfB/YjiJ family MFS transporter [Psychrobacter arenosus]